MVIVLGSHPLHGYSMNRYTELLVNGWREAGVQVTLVRPSATFSMRVRNPQFRKFLVYVENLPLFWLRLLFLRAGRVPVHIADHSDALWLCVPWRPAVSLVTCHDLIAVRAALGEIPEHRTRLSGRAYQFLVRAGLRRASIILPVSATTAVDVERLVPGIPARVVLNPLAPSMDPLGKPVRPIDAPAPYLLVVSDISWRKRRVQAVDLWAHAAGAEEERLDLVLVGSPLSQEESAVARSVLRGEVRVMSALSDEALMHLYAGALAVVQVSRHEGFGWPVIEGNIHGTPAICADLPVLREIGPHNVFVDDDLDAVDWVSAMAMVRSLEVREAVRHFAQRYRIDRFARRLADCLAEAVGEHG